MNIEKERDAQAYATNLLISKAKLNPKTGFQQMSEEDIREAKARVDANEK